MKKTRFFTAGWATFLALLLAAPALAAGNPFKTKAPFQSAIIRYVFSGHEVGEGSAYYQGETTAVYKKTTTKLVGITRRHETLTVLTPDRLVNVDLAKKKAKATGNPLTYMAEEYDRLSPAEKERVDKNVQQTAQMLTGSLAPGMSETKPGTFLGRTVDVTTSQTASVYSLPCSSVVLRHEYVVMGLSSGKKDLASTKTVMEAAEFLENVPVPADKLQPPRGIEVVFDEKADRALRDQVRQWVVFLADPEFEKKMRAMTQMTQKPSEEKEGASTSGDEPPKKKGRVESVKEGVGKAAQESADKVKKIFKR